MHRFLNWCLKLEYNPDGRRLKGYRKASALEADWKYFRVYYTKVTKQEMSKEMGVAVRTVCSLRLDPSLLACHLTLRAGNETLD
jgi:hypothetical protein